MKQNGWIVLLAFIGTVELVNEALYLRFIHNGERAEVAALAWSEVSATVDSLNVKQGRGAGVFDEVIYSYKVGDRVFRGNRDNFYTDWRSAIKPKDSVAMLHKPGGLMIRVNPEAPEESVININYYKPEELALVKLRHWLLFAVSGCVTIVCIWWTRRSGGGAVIGRS